MVWDALTIHADPTGEDRAKPIVPTVAGEFELWLSGKRVRVKRFRYDAVESRPVQDLLRREYRHVRLDSLEGRTPLTLYRKVLGYWVRKFGLNYRWFQPADVPDETPLEPTTTLTDDFNRSDNTNVSSGAPFGWTEIAGAWEILSNQLKGNDSGFARGVIRADSDLSSADHYAQCDWISDDGGTSRRRGPIARKDSAATKTFYCTCKDGGTSGSLILSKSIAGTLTDLDTDSISFTTPDTFRVTCNGSSIEHFLNGVSRGSVTDTDISGNLRTGITGQFESSHIFDNFEAADLGGGSSGNPWYYYQQAG